ncbi:MAG TPA: Rrf2 family transcriptional regulator [Acidimicrobiales bacterium]|nr:Rrf2 family transcriptional regulator [Acidimicrobiales bacterium]
MYISAKADYALRALVTLAKAERPMTADALATSQELPVNYLEAVLLQLRRSGILTNQRGPDAGYRFRGSPSEVKAADVLRAVDGPLAEVRGLRPEATSYPEDTVVIQELWVAVRAGLRQVLETVTIQNMADGQLPDPVRKLVDDPDSWASR